MSTNNASTPAERRNAKTAAIADAALKGVNYSVHPYPQPDYVPCGHELQSQPDLLLIESA